MSASEEISSVREIVKELLEKYVKYRDSDRKLCCRVWQIQLQSSGRDIKTLSSYDMFALYCNGDILSSHESITRAARLIKEHNPELEGNKTERVKECGKVISIVINGK